MKCQSCDRVVRQAELDSANSIFPSAESFCEDCAQVLGRCTATHEIGGVCVDLTPAQAHRWNTASTTDHDLTVIPVTIPVADNQVRYVSLRRATNARLEPEVAAMLLNRAANRIGEWHS